MDAARVLVVIEICLPVFAMIALGILLRRSGRMEESHQGFLTWFVNTFCLPALIFGAVAKQDFADLVNLPMIVSSIGGTLLMLAIGGAMALLLRRRLGGGVLGPMVFTLFWGNVSYLGFPLANSAYGAEGDAAAAMFNAFAMPCYVILGILVIQIAKGAGSARELAAALWKAVTNPIVLAAGLGALCALVFHLPGVQALYHGENAGLLRSGVGIIAAFLELVGSAGLPVALLCIGFALRWQALGHHRALLAFSLVGKLLLAPLAGLMIYRLVFGITAGPTLVIGVLLMGVPTAVASYVISRQMEMDSPFVAAHLTISTAIGCLSLPVWLYFLM